MTRVAVLRGIGSWLPPRRVPNSALPAELNTSDEWIRLRTGIAQRYLAEPGSATSDLAVRAGARALAHAELSEVDAVVVTTTTPDRPCPGIAPEVTWRLGLGNVGAYDVMAVCAGFVYALANAAGMIAAGIVDRVLVIAAETFSSILNPLDRTTAVIFGDGAAAVVLTSGHPDEPGCVGPFDLGSDGEHSGLIAVPAGGSRQRLSGQPVPPEEHYFTMDGREVFRHAVLRMAASTRTVLDRAGWRAADLDHLVSHQANSRILHRLAEDLGLDPARAVSNIARVGNTAAASIPLALADAFAAGALRTGDRLVLTAFGGGLAWGSVALTWPSLTCPGLAATSPTERGAHA